MVILTYFKIAGVLVVVLTIGYLTWNYQHMKTVIEKQQIEIKNIQLSVEVIEKARAATQRYLDTKTQVQRRTVRDKAKIDSMVETANDNALRDLFIRSGMLSPSKDGPTPDRKSSNP